MPAWKIKMFRKIDSLQHYYKLKILNLDLFFFSRKKEPIIFGKTTSYHAKQERGGVSRGRSLSLGARREPESPSSIEILNFIL